MTNPLTIWSNRALSADLHAEFEKRLAPHRIRWAADAIVDVTKPAGSDAALVEECDVAFGQPTVEDLFAAKKLKLVCLTSAGYTRYDRNDLQDHLQSRGIALCNASGVYSEPCAQHALAMMLSLSRRLPAALDDQRTTRRWPTPTLRDDSVLLTGNVNVLIVGYGAIARRLVELLAPFGVKVTAFRRRPTGNENCRTLPIDSLNAKLGEADVIVNILPASSSTANFFDANRFAVMKPGTKFINIGRGDTADQSALIAALNSGQVGTAYLDVTTPEPLPPEHPLWTTPNCYITPHTAGGSVDEADRQVAHFIANIDRFVRDEKLLDRIF